MLLPLSKLELIRPSSVLAPSQGKEREGEGTASLGARWPWI